MEPPSRSWPFPAQPTGLRSAPGPPECSWLSRGLSRLFYGFPRRGAATRNARRRARPQALLLNATHWPRRLHLLSSPSVHCWTKPAALMIKLLSWARLDPFILFSEISAASQWFGRQSSKPGSRDRYLTVAWRSLGDEVSIKNQRIKSRCVECPDRIEWRIDDRLAFEIKARVQHRWYARPCSEGFYKIVISFILIAPH